VTFTYVLTVHLIRFTPSTFFLPSFPLLRTISTDFVLLSYFLHIKYFHCICPPSPFSYALLLPTRTHSQTETVLPSYLSFFKKSFSLVYDSYTGSFIVVYVVYFHVYCIVFLICSSPPISFTLQQISVFCVISSMSL
jgi:hypothetical protein